MQPIALAESFQALLAGFSSAFQLQSYRNFVTLATGWLLTSGRHTITGVVRTAKGHESKHFSSFHAFFSLAKWSFDDLWRVVFDLCIAWVPDGERVPLAGDDTLARKQGGHIRGASMHHDPLLSTTKRVYLHFGHCWVVLSVVLRLPFTFLAEKAVAIPVLAWLYRSQADCDRLGVAFRTKTAMMREMIAVVASWAPHREFDFTGDSAYGCEMVVKNLPRNVHCVCRLRMDAALYDPPPPRKKGDRGRPRKKGERLPTPKMIAEDPKIPWKEVHAFLYGRWVTTTIKTIKALWYTTAGDRLLQIVIVRDPSGERYDEAFFTTDLSMTEVQILERFGLRWSLETLFENAKQCLGFEDPQNRTDKAVERTAPFALLITGLVILWYAGNSEAATPYLPEVPPWYTTKEEVGISFADMLAAVRRMSFREIILQEADGKRVPEKVLDVVLHLLQTAA